MNTALVSGSGLAVWLAMSSPALSADPPANEVRTPAPARPKPADSAATDIATTVSPPPQRKTLDLRIGNFKNYMMPNEYLAAIGAPDADQNTVVVEGQRLLPMELIENVPGGLFGLWYAAKHPLNAWRLLAPVAHQAEIPRPDVVPKRDFSPGPVKPGS
jgi:hypothetical protein